MSIIKRKVAFYLLTINCVEEDGNSKNLDNIEVKKQFNKIYDTLKVLKKDRRAELVEFDGGKYVIEIVKNNSDVVIIKVGRQNPSDSVALRDEKTLVSERVKMANTQSLEVFTYLMIDFKTCIVSYISTNLAPRITLIREFLDSKLNKGLHSQISSILTDDIVDVISKKQVINSIKLSIAVPPDEILADKFGIGEKNFKEIFKNNIKEQIITYECRSVRNKNLLNGTNSVSEAIDSILDKFKDSIKLFHIKAKDDNEKMQTYDVMHYNYTKIVDLYDNKKQRLLEEDYIKALEDSYESNKESLKKYCRTDRKYD